MADLWGDAFDPFMAEPQQPGGALGDALAWLYRQGGDPQSGFRRYLSTSGEALGEAPAGIARGVSDIGTMLHGVMQRQGMAEAGLPPAPESELAPVGPGLKAVGGALDFYTGGYASGLASPLHALTDAGRLAAPVAAPLVHDALAPVLADTSGALRLSPAALRRQQITLERPLPEVPELAAGEARLGHNLGPGMPDEPLGVVEPLPREPQSAAIAPPLPPLAAQPQQLPATSLTMTPTDPVEPDAVPGLLDPAAAQRFSIPGTRASNPMAIPADYEDPLNRKVKRTDPTVGSPTTAEPFKLPDGTFIGPVDVNQWIARTEKYLPGQGEIEKAADWYKEALPAYTRYFGDKGPAMMGAWLIANQNADPAFAQLSATRALEQYIGGTRGKPESLKPGLAENALFDYWDSVLSGNSGRLAKSGQKIYDFVDSAAGKNTRTFYGDDPRAGAPAVADVHTLRDTGKIDPTLHDWVRKNYGDEVANQITPDSPSSPGEAQYEWSADRVRKWTADLNAMKWRGRDDWTPEQVQAIGWKSMSAMLGRPGLTAEDAIRSMERHLSYELDFGAGAPYHQTFPEWGTLTTPERIAVSNPVLDSAMQFALKETGGQESWRQQGVGAWKQDLNPAAYRSQFLSSPEVVHDIASIMGYLGQQTAVYGSRFMPGGKDFTVLVRGHGLDENSLRQIWAEVVRKHPDLAQGFSPAQDANGIPGVDIGIQSINKTPNSAANQELLRRLKTELLPTIQQEADKLGIDTNIGIARTENVEPTNDWTKNPNGEAHLSRLTTRYGSGLLQRMEDHKRTQLEPLIRREIAKAIEARGKGGRTVGNAAPRAGQEPASPGSPQGVATPNGPPKGLLSE